MPSFNFIDLNHLCDIMLIPVCMLAGALVVGIVLNRAINNHLEQNLQLDEDTLQYVFVKALKGVPISFCLIAGLYWIINTIDIHPGISKLFSYILFTVNVFTLTRVTARAVVGFADMQMARSEGKLPKTTLLNKLISFIIYAVGVIVILQYYGISVTPIITAMGVGGMAIAFGLQETLANIFAGLQLIIFKQLRIGDFIQLNSGESGRVTDITWRYTTILSLTGNVVVVPNKSIAAAIITNFNLPYMDVTIKIPVGVAYGSDLEQVERVTLEVANKVMNEAQETSELPPKVFFRNFGDSSIEFDVLLHSTRFDNQLILKHNFIKELTKRYRLENIDIPFPIRTVYQGK